MLKLASEFLMLLTSSFASTPATHLGDEYLLHQSPQRINLSFEALEVMIARDFGGLRIYGGGENIFSHQPSDPGEKIVHFGFD